MYLYAAEHQLMDYFMNPDKAKTPEAETPKVEETNETDIIETE